MNKQQLTYAMERLDNVYREKRHAIHNECTTKGKVVTVDALVGLIKSGKLKVKTSGSRVIDRYIDISTVFNLEPFQSEDELDKEKHDSRIKKLDDEFTKIKDELVIGDSDKAMELLKRFTSAKF